MSVRVLHVIPAVAPRYGGPSTAVVEMSRALVERGVDVTIATTDADGASRLRVDHGVVTDYHGVPTVFHRRVGADSFKWSPALAEWLMAHAGEFDLMHIHAVFSHATLAAGRACLRRSVPYIVRPLGTLDPWSLARHARRKQVLLRVGLRRVLARASAMHYTTASEQALATSANPWLPRACVIPLGVNETLFADVGRVAHESSSLVTMCRVDPKKGIEVLIEAFHRACAHAPAREWRLLIAGDGDPQYLRTLRRRADEGAGAARIAFLGWLTASHKQRLLTEARLFVLPSMQENFGLSVAEAMAAGCPVIVGTGVNLGADIVRAGAGWVVESDPGALQLAIDSAWDEPAELARRGTNARAEAERYRWAGIAASLAVLYDGIRQRAH